MKRYRYSVEYVGENALCRYKWTVERNDNDNKGPFSKNWNYRVFNHTMFEGGAIRAAKRYIRQHIREAEKAEKRMSLPRGIRTNVEYP